MSEPRKNLSSFFHQFKFIVFKKVQLKKVCSVIVLHLFFSQTYTARYILIGFVYSSVPVDFRAISMSFLSFLSQKTYPGKFLRPKVILSGIYLRKCNIWLPPPFYHKFVIFKKRHKILTVWS